MNSDNINDYLPSILNPRGVRKQQDHSLTQATQNSIASRCSLSLKRPNGLSTKSLNKREGTDKERNALKNKQKVIKTPVLTQAIADNISSGFSVIEDLIKSNKENLINSTTHGILQKSQKDLADNSVKAISKNKKTSQISKEPNAIDEISLGLSFLENFITDKNSLLNNSFESCDIELNTPQKEVISDVQVEETDKNKRKINQLDDTKISLKSISSATSLEDVDSKTESTIPYNLDSNNEECDKFRIKVSFGVKDSEVVDVSAKNGTIKKFSISRNDKNTDIDCEVIENSQISTETELDENMNETSLSPRKRTAVSVNLEIKKQKLTREDSGENSKVLILKTDAIEKISHVIVQPPNYKFVKRKLIHKSGYKNEKLVQQNGISKRIRLKQAAIDSFFRLGTEDCKQLRSVNNDVSKEMSKNSGINEAAKCDRLKSARLRRDLEMAKSPRRDLNESPKSARLPSKKDITSPRRQEIKTTNSDVPSPRIRNESLSAHTPRKNVESMHFNLPVKSKANKTTLSQRNIPHHKIVAGTHFAVDAFSYGDIPNVKHYFLTHFHSDHYSGLKKSFNKLLFCSKITADLCISRLGVNPKNIRMINVDEVLRIEGVEIAAIDANHCPGAIMLVFTLPNGKTLLHTGDFRACPAMESYPVFWNKDIHTVYLDTTYCNPRYDFPTQDQSLEMALYILRQKKLALENAGKKFSSVLIVCGTYTIGKEKFFLGMSRRVGCAVWACPEKERVLQIVEGRPCSRDPPDSCQLHVVPMRDLTHEKLRSYLDSLQGAFSEVVAFKPSGWENGKNSSVEKDLVTIHGIPYSEHSSFSELIRFVKFLKPKQVVPTVDISGGVKSVQKYFPCPLVYKDELHCQTKLTDYFSIHNRQQVPAVT